MGTAGYILLGAYDEIVTGLCGTTIRHVIPAPGGKAPAVIFERDCGATTSFSTQISIVPSGAVFSAEKYPAFLLSAAITTSFPAGMATTQLRLTFRAVKKFTATKATQAVLR